MCYGLVFQEPEFVKNEIRKIFKREDPESELTNQPPRPVYVFVS
jgi:hypothetical protein